MERATDEAGICGSEPPALVVTGEGDARRARLPGVGLDVWQVIEVLERCGSEEALVAQGRVGREALRLAIAYYERHPDEVDAARHAAQ
jgi:uncharacterized protein (DUF433 family)